MRTCCEGGCYLYHSLLYNRRIGDSLQCNERLQDLCLAMEGFCIVLVLWVRWKRRYLEEMDEHSESAVMHLRRLGGQHELQAIPLHLLPHDGGDLRIS